MTAVRRAADAPRAASSISSSSIRCSCTFGTRGWMMNTSASRQLATSCTPKQSLLNRVTDAALRRVFRCLQMALASWGWAFPLKTTILFIQGPRDAGIISDHDAPFLDRRRGLALLHGEPEPDPAPGLHELVAVEHFGSQALAQARDQLLERSAPPTFARLLALQGLALVESRP